MAGRAGVLMKLKKFLLLRAEPTDDEEEEGLGTVVVVVVIVVATLFLEHFYSYSLYIGILSFINLTLGFVFLCQHTNEKH